MKKHLKFLIIIIFYLWSFNSIFPLIYNIDFLMICFKKFFFALESNPMLNLIWFLNTSVIYKSIKNKNKLFILTKRLYAPVSRSIVRVWNKLITLHMPRGDENVSIEVKAAATTPTPNIEIDVTATVLSVQYICWSEVVVLFVVLFVVFEVVVCKVHA